MKIDKSYYQIARDGYSVLLWIIDNQMGRRNLRPIDRVPLDEKRRVILEKMAKERESTSGPDIYGGEPLPEKPMMHWSQPHFKIDLLSQAPGSLPMSPTHKGLPLSAVLGRLGEPRNIMDTSPVCEPGSSLQNHEPCPKASMRGFLLS